jgi:hypothetical protein
LNTIAPDLREPRTTEIRASLQTRLGEHLVLRLGGTDRRTSRLIQPVNSLALSGNFSMTHVDDTGLNLLDPGDDQVLPIFTRLPASYGADAYVLRNVDGNSARDHGLDLVLERAFRDRWGMLIGATIDATYAWATTGPPVMEWRTGYIVGLLYLGIFASALAFVLYFGLIRAIGPAMAAYSGVLVPVIAMLLSTVFEGYRWSPLAAFGCLLALVGLVIALRARRPVR